MYAPVSNNLTRHETAILRGIQSRIADVKRLNAEASRILVDRTGDQPVFLDRATGRFVSKVQVRRIADERIRIVHELADMYGKLEKSHRSWRAARSLEIPKGIMLEMRKAAVSAKAEGL